MAKGLPIIVLLALSVLITKNDAIYFVNNVTVPSDILTTMFFDQIKNGSLNSYDKSVRNTGIYNFERCAGAMEEIVSRFPSLDVLPFMDSWGSLPSGILLGHLTSLGNFDQCVRISADFQTPIGSIKGQYCFASLPLTQNQPVTDLNINYNPRVGDVTVNDIAQLRIGVCIPDVCDPAHIQAIFQTSADEIFNGALSGIQVSRCITEKNPEFNAINIVGIIIFSIIGAMMVLSTAYDVYTQQYKKPVTPSLLAFSLYTNGKKLFAISTTRSPNNIDCLLGIKVLSMFWVLYCHNYYLFVPLPAINLFDLLPFITAASSMHVINATVAVDTFFFISGLLIAWIAFRELDKSKGKLNVPMMYFHRLLRLTPPVAAMILFFVSIFKYIGSGPYKSVYETVIHECNANWWSTLLYVQNYVNPDSTCVAQTWYLAVDTQLYILSPLILIPLWKWGRKFVPVMIILSILSIGCIIGIYFAEGYNDFSGATGRNQMGLIYKPTHTRYSVWLIGVGFGYFLHKNRTKSLRPTKPIQLLGWLVCFAAILGVIYGPYFTINADRAITVLEAAIYESLKRVSWAVAVAWIVFACYSGFGGIINSFLSHPWWQPLGRLTFSMYLVHMGVIHINYGITRTDVYFSNYQMVLLFWSTFGISLMAAIVLTLGFESPVLVIEKTILRRSKQTEERKAITDINRTESVQSTEKSA